MMRDYRSKRPRGRLFFPVLILTVVCLLCYFTIEIIFSPWVSVQVSELVGIWQAEYNTDEFWFCWPRRPQRVVREILILKEDGTYEQRIEDEGEIIRQGHRWWIEKTGKSSVWLHLEKGIDYSSGIVWCCYRDNISSDCSKKVPAPMISWEYNRVMDRLITSGEEEVLSVWKPWPSRTIFLEHLLGDLDSPTVIRFQRVSP